MKLKKVFSWFSTLVIFVSLIGVLPASAAPVKSGVTAFTRQISSSLTTALPAAGTPGTDVTGPDIVEIPPALRDEGAAPQGNAGPLNNSGTQNNPNHPYVGRSETHESHHDSHDPLRSPHVDSSHVVGSNPGLNVSFDGLNHRDQRLANGGNQFSLEPPDQGLCAGNGFVMETINDVLRVYNTSGTPLTGVIDLNTFYGYPAAINRTTGESGPFITDPSCYYDPDTQHWFQIVLTLDTDPGTGDFLGTNHLDLAVSTTSNPTGSWVVYTLPVQDDGSDGTPDHGCSLGPCLGDYPHIGADKFGFYITTNEYSFFGPEFHAAQVYALSKSALAANASTITVVQFDTVGAVNSHFGVQPGFTVWPAISTSGIYNTKSHGTEFFLSSNAGEEANGVPGGSFSNELIVWAMTNTKSLNSASPDPSLDNQVLRSEVYGIPPQSDQKAGDIPLGQCINDTTIVLAPTVIGCWNLFFDTEPAHDEVESHIDSNDTRIQQVWYADGKLWSALDTVVKVNGQDRAGVAYFVVSPDVGFHGVNGDIKNQGYVAVANNNVTYPAIAVLPNGRGVMAFTLVGQNYYPSAAYTSIDEHHGTGFIHVASAGVGPEDGFSGYKAFGDPPRPRWGDYGSAVTDGNKIWIASEYIAQTCTLTQYLTGAIGSCGGTRTSLANWATRISNVTP